jgi:polyisoprenoid-binding protein YceI
MKLILKTALVVLTFSLSGLVQAAVYDIDPAHSQVGFRIRHIVSKVRGDFKTYSGTVDFDEKNPAALKAEATIQTASINTSVDKRDTHLKSGDFFDVEKFPTMSFKSTAAKKLTDNKVQLVGDLTLHGVTKPVTLDVEIGGVSPDPWGNTRAGFSATGKINKKDFNMPFNMGGVIGDEVEILLEVEAIKKK